MRIYWSDSNNPIENLAVEQYFLKEQKDDILLFYINKQCVICGRLQNPYSDLDTDLIFKNHIPIYRRHSGGGSVFHDHGNLNYAFIMNHNTERDNYRFYNSIIINALISLGFRELINDQTNIFHRGLKISGTAQYKYRNRLLHHGTLLINSDLNFISQLFKYNDRYTSKSVKSNIVNVGNLYNKVLMDYDSNDCLLKISNAICEQVSKSVQIEQLNPSSLSIDDNLNQLSSDNWIYKSPDYQFLNRFYFRRTQYLISFIVQKGIIQKFKIKGERILSRLELTNQVHSYSQLKMLLNRNSDILLSEAETEQLLTYLF